MTSLDHFREVAALRRSRWGRSASHLSRELAQPRTHRPVGLRPRSAPKCFSLRGRRPAPERSNRMVGFLFRLETAEGALAEPPTVTSAVPNWRPGDTIPLGRGRTLRVVSVRGEEADQPPVLVVEEAV